MKQRSWLQVAAGDEQQWHDAIRSDADCLIVDLGDHRLPETGEFPLGSSAAMLPNTPHVFLQIDQHRLQAARPVIGTAVVAGISGIVLRAPANGAGVQELDVMLAVEEAIAGRNIGDTRIVAMIGDSPAGILNAASFGGCSKRLVGIGWDVATLSRATGATRSSALSLAAQTTTVLTAYACRVGAIDTSDHEEDMEIFRSKCVSAKAEGFTGKIAVSAPQIQLINTVFSDKT